MGIPEHRALVTDELNGERADKALAVLAGVSRATAKALLESGDATFDGATVAPSSRVATGSELVARLPAPARLEPEAVPFDVLFDDAEMAVIDKPAGVVVHPGAGNRRGTLAAGIIHRWPEVEGVGEEHRWGIVHRLDRDTSGALIIAKSPPAHDALRRAMARREIVRNYVAAVGGRFAIPTGTIDAPIGRNPDDPTRFAVAADGRPAVTHYEVRRQFDDAALLDVTLETGRTHQIRVHLASIGHPVVGDRTYGGAPGAPRLFLHAVAVTFHHPGDGRMLTVESPLPRDLADALEALS